MKKLKQQWIIFFICVFIYGACSPNQEVNKDEEKIIQNQDSTQKKVNSEQIFYRIPTPDELYALIQESSLQYKPNLMNPKINSENYTDKGKRAVNLGVYTADLAYAAAYEDYQKAIDYFDIIFEMSDEVGFSSVFTEGFLERIKTNLSNIDSLVNITNETYYSIVRYLEINDKQNILVLTSVGGWIESMYVALNLIGDYDPTNEAVQRVLEQKLVYENLVNYMTEYKNSPEITPYYKLILELKPIFEKIKEVEMESKPDNKEGEKIIIGGGRKLEITEENYNEIKNKIEEIRTNIIK